MLNRQLLLSMVTAGILWSHMNLPQLAWMSKHPLKQWICGGENREHALDGRRLNYFVGCLYSKVASRMERKVRFARAMNS